MSVYDPGYNPLARRMRRPVAGVAGPPQLAGSPDPAGQDYAFQQQVRENTARKIALAGQGDRGPGPMPIVQQQQPPPMPPMSQPPPPMPGGTARYPWNVPPQTFSPRSNRPRPPRMLMRGLRRTPGY